MKNIIDVSDWQGVIDWEKVKPQIDGVMIRGGWSYGEEGMDKQFKYNISECNRLGIPCGVYWFSYAINDEEAKLEAEWCLEQVKPYRLEMPIAWDYENASTDYAKRQGVTVTRAMVTRWAYIFLETIERAGYWGTLYSNKAYLQTYFEKDIEKRFDLWYAAWTDETPAYDTSLSYPCGMWQYGAKKYDGIQGNVDSNYCYKNYPELFELCGRNHLDRPIYTPAQAWAIEQGITDGSDGDKTVTKAELWEILYKIHKK